MFIRIKKIKGNEYAYLVRNKWTKQGPRQISKKYLGRVLELDRVKDEPYNDLSILSKTRREVLREIYKNELSSFNFKETGSHTMKLGKLTARLGEFAVYEDDKERVIKNRDGYLASSYLQKILRYYPKRKSFEKDSIEFAKLIVNSGLSLDKEFFVEFFKRIYNNSI